MGSTPTGATIFNLDFPPKTMKIATVKTVQTILQFRKYEIEVPDDFPDVIDLDFLDKQPPEATLKMIWEKIGQADEEVIDERVISELID